MDQLGPAAAILLAWVQVDLYKQSGPRKGDWIQCEANPTPFLGLIHSPLSLLLPSPISPLTSLLLLLGQIYLIWRASLFCQCMWESLAFLSTCRTKNFMTLLQLHACASETTCSAPQQFDRFGLLHMHVYDLLLQ